MTQSKLDFARYRYLFEKDQNNPPEYNTPEYKELIHYGAVLWCHLIYQKKEEYYLLIQSYLRNQMSTGDFADLFYQKNKNLNNNFNQIEKNLLESQLSFLEYDAKGQKFSELLHLISYEIESLSDETSDHTDETFQKFIQQIFQKITDLLNS